MNRTSKQVEQIYETNVRLAKKLVDYDDAIAAHKILDELTTSQAKTIAELTAELEAAEQTIINLEAK